MIRLGVVTAASPLTVTLDGASTAVKALHLAAYTPVVADRVAVLPVGSQILVLGKVL